MQPVEHEEIPHGLLAEPRLNLRQAVPCIGVEAAAALLREQRPSPGRHTTGFLSGRAIVSASVCRDGIPPYMMMAQRMSLIATFLFGTSAGSPLLIGVDEDKREIMMLSEWICKTHCASTCLHTGVPCG